jgi:hypothetical protein
LAFTFDLHDCGGTFDWRRGKLAQGQKGRLLSADIDESRSKAMVDANDPTEIDIAGAAFSPFVLDVEFHHPVIVEQCSPSMTTPNGDEQTSALAAARCHYSSSIG